MGRKFDELYYKPNNQVLPVEDFWRAFDKDCQAARDKYENNIYCPLCQKARLTWADGIKRRYFRAFTNHVDCDYQYDELTKKEVKDVKENLSDVDIKAKLQTCINRIFRKENKTFLAKLEGDEFGKRKNDNTLLTVQVNNVTKHIPTRLWDNILLEDDEGVDKIYFGKCKCYWEEYHNGKINIYIYSYSRSKYIGKIVVSNVVKEYLTKELNLISLDKKNRSFAIVSLWAEPVKCDVGCKFYLRRSTYIRVKILS